MESKSAQPPWPRFPRSPLGEPFSLGPPPDTTVRGGVVVVHGFAGSPFEMRELGHALAAAGYLVEGPRLSGHGDDNRSLQASSWPEWVGTVERAVEALAKRVPTVYVCGQSLGGLLALEVSARNPAIRATVSLAAPIFLNAFSEGAIRVLRRNRLLRQLIVPRMTGSDCADPAMKQQNGEAIGPLGLPVKAVGSLIDLMDHLRPRLPLVRQPVLLVHALQDHVAPYDCMAAIAAGLTHSRVDTLSLSRSYHLVSIDVERREVFDAVLKHFARNAQPSGSAA